MEPFTTLSSVAIPLIRDNIDTDAIIPSREMKAVSKRGLAEGLFAGWRYRDAATRDPDPDFVLNHPGYLGAQIMLGGANFGCGSSREHAVWALAEYGIRAVIAPSFSPIFRGNCVNNGVLPIAIDPVPLVEAGGIVEIDLAGQTVSAGGRTWPFEIEGEAKLMLGQGLDAIALTLLDTQAIDQFEAADRIRRGWAWSGLPNADQAAGSEIGSANK